MLLHVLGTTETLRFRTAKAQLLDLRLPAGGRYLFR
jgi:hypothetical protein